MTLGQVFLYRRRRWLLGICLAAWALAFAATHVPQSKVPGMHVSDLTLHFVGYAGLAGLFAVMLTGYLVGTAQRVGLVLSTMAAYGAVDEITQQFVNRTPAVADWLSDVGGTIVAIILWETAFRLIQKTWPGKARRNSRRRVSRGADCAAR